MTQNLVSILHISSANSFFLAAFMHMVCFKPDSVKEAFNIVQTERAGRMTCARVDALERVTSSWCFFLVGLTMSWMFQTTGSLVMGLRDFRLGTYSSAKGQKRSVSPKTDRCGPHLQRAEGFVCKVMWHQTLGSAYSLLSSLELISSRNAIGARPRVPLT